METTAKTTDEVKHIHGWVTAWLVLMIILNSLTALLYLFAGDMISENFPANTSITINILLDILGILNVVFP